MTAIKTTMLKKIYKKGIRKKTVESLKGIDLTVEKGDIFGFIGPNGAGKSTTIKILTGLLKPSGGNAWLYDKPVYDPASRISVGYLPENPRFYRYLSLFDFLLLVAGIRGIDRKSCKTRINELIELVGLEKTDKRPLRTFSKGMVQRAGIAMALLHDPDLVILDEPMSGLDPLGRDLVAKIFMELQSKGKTIFFSTHIIPDIEELCDSVGILVNGEIKYTGTVQELLYSGEDDMIMTISLPDAYGGTPDKGSTSGNIDSGDQLENDADLIWRELRENTHLIWQKGDILRLKIKQEALPEYIRVIASAGGSIIKLEQKRKNFEALFKELTLKGEKLKR